MLDAEVKGLSARGGKRDGAGAPKKEDAAPTGDASKQEEPAKVITPDNIPVTNSLRETAAALLANGATLEKTGDRNPPTLGEGDGAAAAL